MVEILSEQFPVRDIIGLRTTLLLNFNGGGIHCQTQQEPAVGRL
jgi:agmatine/peptidylarginine deiminase